MMNITHLLKLAEEYMRAAAVSETTLSSRLFDDGKKLRLLREGKDLTTARFNGALEWFSANWPSGATWPDDVQRPLVAA